MRPEDLKQLAEYMGYENVQIIRNKTVWINKSVIYRPLTNAEQDRELEIKFKMDTRPINDFWGASARGAGTSTGKTPSEARLNAAIAAIKE